MDFKELQSNIKLFDGMDRLNYLLDLSKLNPGIESCKMVDENRIWGCVSKSFLIIEQTDPYIIISTESDSSFVKGLLYILKVFVKDKTVNDIKNLDEIKLMEDIGLKNAISSQRINGVYAAIKKLKKSLCQK